jgi:Restriction endonuclease NaeI
MSSDLELDAVWAELQRTGGIEKLLAQTLRQALDEVIDGARTGRFAVDQLEKTEKTYIGTKVEILLRYAFEWTRGVKLDNLIAAVEVDTKFSLTGQWMIPREARGELCLLASADDRKAKFSVGLLRMTPEVLNAGTNQDGKTSVSADGKKGIRWICFQQPMTANFLLNLDPAVVANTQAHRSGKARITAFFEQVTGCLIPRSVVLQIIKLPGDPMKRAREAKATLLLKGYRVLCATYAEDRKAMHHAGFPHCADDDWLSIKEGS